MILKPQYGKPAEWLFGTRIGSNTLDWFETHGELLDHISWHLVSNSPPRQINMLSRIMTILGGPSRCLNTPMWCGRKHCTYGCGVPHMGQTDSAQWHNSQAVAVRVARINALCIMTQC
ncbi:unnamed protein product [Pieris macdunnoughi]|uniref:Uncharacterized protein n=1 Tax=Pieris macdunnoughi TaxID=345717 RepID=A0A821WXG0_9NEOP|nr:unnamed protein product [Pieris macdunnoughi]